jgi:hypothetical protein
MKITSNRGNVEIQRKTAKKQDSPELSQSPLTKEEQDHIAQVFDSIRKQLDNKKADRS